MSVPTAEDCPKYLPQHTGLRFPNEPGLLRLKHTRYQSEVWPRGINAILVEELVRALSLRDAGLERCFERAAIGKHLASDEGILAAPYLVQFAFEERFRISALEIRWLGISISHLVFGTGVATLAH